jgi:hypothetical protein
MAEELPATDYSETWGERTGDLFLNDDAYFGNVPELVWNYQLGGYPVLKKWLGYRQADRGDGKALTNDEGQWFRQIIQRVAAGAGVRVDGLDLAAASFSRVEPKVTGRPGYAPADLLKLYIYGYLNRVRSSRRLEAETHRNIEVIWLLRHLSRISNHR